MHTITIEAGKISPTLEALLLVSGAVIVSSPRGKLNRADAIRRRIKKAIKDGTPLNASEVARELSHVHKAKFQTSNVYFEMKKLNFKSSRVNILQNKQTTKKENK